MGMNIEVGGKKEYGSEKQINCGKTKNVN